MYNNGEFICQNYNLKNAPAICAGRVEYGVEINDIVFANWALLMCIITFA